VSDAEADYRQAEILPGASLMLCPECGHELPLHTHTECDRCGAHLELMYQVHAPGIDP